MIKNPRMEGQLKGEGEMVWHSSGEGTTLKSKGQGKPRV